MVDTLVFEGEALVSDLDIIEGHLKDVQTRSERLRVLVDEINGTLSSVSEQNKDISQRLERVRRGALDMLIRSFEKQHLLRGAR